MRACDSEEGQAEHTSASDGVVKEKEVKSNDEEQSRDLSARGKCVSSSKWRQEHRTEHHETQRVLCVINWMLTELMKFINSLKHTVYFPGSPD